LRYWTDIGQKTADTEYSANVAGALANIAVLPGPMSILQPYVCNMDTSYNFFVIAKKLINHNASQQIAFEVIARYVLIITRDGLDPERSGTSFRLSF
jgi:hypothetical protein